MSQSTLEMTKDLVLAQIRSGSLFPEDVPDAIHHIYQNLLALKSREESGAPVAETPQAPTNWRKSITRNTITCLECGAHLKQLTGLHLRVHGLDARSYRRKYGIPSTQPLTARETAAKRRKIAAEVRPWEKAPTYLKAQEQKAETAKKAGRKSGARKR